MKKSAIVLAVAAALAASAAVQAETTFYGRLAVGVTFNDPDNGDSNTDVANHGSRWGVRGSEDLGNGLSAVYRMETAIGADTFHGGSSFGGRLAYVGLSGGFGKITLGSEWSPYYDVAGRTDIFNSVGFAGYSGVFRRQNSVKYTTPGSLSAFSAGAMIVMDGAAGEDSVDEYNLGVNVEVGPAGGGIAFLQNEVTDEDQWIVTASAEFSGFSAGFVYEDTENADWWNIAGQYVFGSNIVKASYGELDPDGGNEQTAWAIGFQHNLSKRTRTWVEYEDVEDSQSRFRVGLRHDF